MIRHQPIRTPGQPDPETGEKQPDTLSPPDEIRPIEFRDGYYWTEGEPDEPYPVEEVAPPTLWAKVVEAVKSVFA